MHELTEIDWGETSFTPACYHFLMNNCNWIEDDLLLPDHCPYFEGMDLKKAHVDEEAAKALGNILFNLGYDVELPWDRTEGPDGNYTNLENALKAFVDEINFLENRAIIYDDHITEDIERLVKEKCEEYWGRILVLKGKVVEKGNENPIPDVNVELYKTMVKITNDNYACYIEPNTTSDQISRMDKGDYPVLDIKLNHPNTDTDYVKIKTGIPENKIGWICSKWKGTGGKKKHTALLFEEKVKGQDIKTSQDGSFSINVSKTQLYKIQFFLKKYFDAKSERILPTRENLHIELEKVENNIQESYIIDRLKDFKNFSYSLENARYPYELPDISIPQAPPKQNNCCTFVEALLVKAWKDALADNFNWSNDKHGEMMITSTSDYYSPITAVTKTGMAIEIDKDKLPPAWTIVQGWKTQWTGGHTFIIVDVHPETERVLTLESNASYKMNGPGFRMLGDIDDYTNCTPDKDWWKKEELWDWEKFKKTYKHRKMARLKLYDLKWVK